MWTSLGLRRGGRGQVRLFNAVTCAIPGGKQPEQVTDNCGASGQAPLTHEAMSGVRKIYKKKIRALVHDRW